MRGKESYAVLLLAVGFGVMVFLSYDFMGMGLRNPSSAPVLPPIIVVPKSNLSPPQNEPVQNFFLPAYSDQELRSFRDIFLAKRGISSAEEFIIAVEEPDSSTEKKIPEVELEPLPEEQSVQVTVKGMVVSPQGKAIIVEIDGNIRILTSQKPLQEGVKLVKVEGKQVTLEYQGREFVFSLAE